jgi:lipopolysaccharide export system permease protein
VRLFDRYVAGYLLIHFGFFSLILVAVYWVNRALGLFDDLIAGGSNLWVFLRLTALALPGVIAAVLPVSALVAAIYGVNRLSADSELVVARTTGLSPWRLARPVAAFGLVVALLLSLLGHVLVPMSRTALAEGRVALADDVTARFLKAGEFLQPARGITVYMRAITEEGRLLGLFLQDRNDPGSVTTYTAESGLLVRDGQGTRLVMVDGTAQTMDVATRSLITTLFADFTYDLAALGGDGGGTRRMDPRELPTAMLLRAGPEAVAATSEDRAKLLYEGHARFSEAIFAAALPLLALGFLMLGGFSRLGLWRQISGAVLVAVAARMAANAAETAARGDANLWWLAYAVPALTLLLATLLIWRGTFGGRLLRGRTAAA